MSEVTTRPATRATKASAHSKAAPSPAPTQPPLSEGDKLALEAAQVLVGILDNLLHPSYGSSLCHLRNFHLEEADHLLNLLVAPEDQMRSVEDPVAADILDHLTRISSALESAEEVAHLRDIPGYVPSEQALATAVISFANDFAERLFLAYKNLPGSLADLRTLTTSAGARQFRERPTPPIRRVDQQSGAQAGYHHRPHDIQRVFETLETQCEALRDFSVDIRARLQGESGGVVQACNDLTIIQHMAAFMGSMCEEMSGETGGFIGGPAAWATMDGIEAIGGAA